MSQDYSSKEAFEKSMSGYHKEAPAYLKKKREELHTAGKSKHYGSAQEFFREASKSSPTKTKALEKKVNPRAKAFEEKTNMEEKQMLRERKSRIKKGGFSSERDYFEHA